jgi:hypothetical protein
MRAAPQNMHSGFSLKSTEWTNRRGKYMSMMKIGTTRQYIMQAFPNENFYRSWNMKRPEITPHRGIQVRGRTLSSVTPGLQIL